MFLLAYCAVSYAELYKWVDQKGKIHYSDRPLNQKAEKYSPPPLQTIPALPTETIKPLKKSSKDSSKYELIQITTPKQDQILTHDQTDIAVNVRLKPGLDIGKSHKLAIYLDGSLYAEGSKFSYSISNTDRGTHNIYAAVLDDTNKVLIKTEPVSFHVKRHHR